MLPPCFVSVAADCGRDEEARLESEHAAEAQQHPHLLHLHAPRTHCPRGSLPAALRALMRLLLRCVLAQNVADKFVNDLRASVAEILQVGPGRLAAARQLLRWLPLVPDSLARAQNPSMYKDGAAAIYGA